MEELRELIEISAEEFYYDEYEGFDLDSEESGIYLMR